MFEWDYIDFLTQEKSKHKDRLVAAALSADLGRYLFSLPVRRVGSVELCADEDVMSELRELLQHINSVKMFKKTAKVLAIGGQAMIMMHGRHRMLMDRFGVRVAKTGGKHAPSLQAVMDEVQGIMAGSTTQMEVKYSHTCRVCYKRLTKAGAKKCSRCGQVYCSRKCQVVDQTKKPKPISSIHT